MDQGSFGEQISEMRDAMASIREAMATFLIHKEIVHRIATVDNEEDLVAILDLSRDRGYPLSNYQKLEAHFASRNEFQLARIVNTHIIYNFNT